MSKRAKDEALRRAMDKINQNPKPPLPTVEEPIEVPEESGAPSSPETDPELQKKFPDAPQEREPEEEPEVKYPQLDCKISFSCSAHGPQPLKEVRYTTIVLACGCEWVYDCGYLSQLRRGPGK